MGAFFGAFRSKRVGMLVGLGFASGLPLAMSGSTLSTWMTKAGVNIKTIGLFALVSLPYSFKFLWAPFLDRFSLPFMGRRRGWMALAQVALAAGIWMMSSLDPRSMPMAMAAAALTVAFLSASQDIVSDAYRTDVLPADERASGTSTFVFGYRVAMLLSGAGALALSDYLAWPTVFKTMAVLMLPMIVITWRAPEPEGARPPRTLADAFTKPFFDFFSRPGALRGIGFIMLYKLGDYVSSQMIQPFLIKTGFSGTEIAAWSKFVGFGGIMVGVLLGGGMVAKFGVRRSLLVFGILASATNSGYLALSIVGKNHLLLAAAVGIHNLCSGMAEAAFAAFMMSLCNKSFSATQYALLSSASTVVGRTLGAGAGYLIAAAGWTAFFATTMAMAAPALLLLAFVPKEDTATTQSGRGPTAKHEDRNNRQRKHRQRRPAY
jgi:MFS transporter, PAT family, beta-lactamase induction signal transducer AmpG